MFLGAQPMNKQKKKKLRFPNFMIGLCSVLSRNFFRDSLSPSL